MSRRRRKRRSSLVKKIRRVVRSMRKRHYAKVVRGGAMMS